VTVVHCSLVAAAALALAAAPGEEFVRGRNAFFRAEYQRAIEILRPLLYPEPRLDSEEETVQAHRMLGVAYLFEQKTAEARLEFKKLLQLRPDYRFDPLLDPPRVVDFFNSVVREQESGLAELEARRRKHEAQQAARRPPGVPGSGVTVERRYEKRSLVVAFVPFGAGQFQNGERRKGWTFLLAESALAAVSVSAFATNYALFGVRPVRRCLVEVMPAPDGTPGMCPPDRIDHSDEELSGNLTKVQVASGALFFAVAAWGVVDAVRHFRPEVPVDDGGGGAAAPAPPAPASGRPAAPAATRLRFGPFLSPHTQGFALGFAF
jgi:hypothetical protein